jgi:hypothetical protein
MKTAVSQMIKELQEQFPKEMGDMYERNQLLLEDIALRAKELEKEQQIEFACQVYDKYNFGTQEISFREECEQFKKQEQ